MRPLTLSLAFFFCANLAYGGMDFSHLSRWTVLSNAQREEIQKDGELRLSLERMRTVMTQINMIYNETAPDRIGKRDRFALYGLADSLLVFYQMVKEELRPILFNDRSGTNVEFFVKSLKELDYKWTNETVGGRHEITKLLDDVLSSSPVGSVVVGSSVPVNQ